MEAAAVEKYAAEHERTDLAGVVVKAEQILCDEWFGAVDPTIEAYGENPQAVFDGKVDSCPAGAHCTTVVGGVLLQSDEWRLLIRTHAFPQHIDFTTNSTAISEFLKRYT